MLKQVIFASMIDYPKNISSVLFFDKCNFNCEYCYNKQLKKMEAIHFEKDVLPKLLERKDFVNHIILSGGECTCDPEIEKILDILYNFGFIIGIHTNGYNPNFIQENINKISFIGMDIKNSFDNYDNICGIKVDIKKIEKSINIIISSGINYEFRTTVYPKYNSKEDCVKIAKKLKELGAKEYYLQQYQDVENICKPYSNEEMNDIRKECDNYIPTKLKGML